MWFLRDIVLAAAAALTIGTAPALAADAQVVDGGAYVRSGPGTGYRIIASLPGGITVGVGRCAAEGRWCRVFTGRGRGWVAFSRLAFPYTGRPGQENYEFGQDGNTGGTIGAEGEPSQGYVKILGVVVDKPGYCYALSHSGQSIIVKCP